MARRYHEIKGLAEFTAKIIVSDEEQWKKFLHTAGHMYKYPFRERENDLFNTLKDEHMYFGKVELDINPINTAETGPLAQYLPGVEKYLEEKAEKMEQNKIVAFPEKKEPKPPAKVEEREEQNYNMIDNVINNLPQDPEEKKEPAPQREMREAEVKKVRKRVSLKALLPLKKAEVAEREKKPPEASAPSRRPGMGVDD